ncbi:hypothetical protein ACRAWD_18570 [Caulobacter segnis]
MFTPARSRLAYAAVAGAIQRVEVERAYDLTLPSFNIAADLTDTFVARFSAAKTIARPGYRLAVARRRRLGAGRQPQLQLGQPVPEAHPVQEPGCLAGMVPVVGHDAGGRLLLQADRHLRRHPAPRGRSTTPWACRTRCMTGTGCHARPGVPSHPAGKLGRRRDLKGFELKRPAALHLPAGLAEPLRRHRQLHLCRLQDRVSDLDHPGRARRSTPPWWACRRTPPT